jgi:hypothetical protein
MFKLYHSKNTIVVRLLMIHFLGKVPTDK